MFASRIMAVAATIAAIAPAYAAAPLEPTPLHRQVSIPTGDLNLTSAAGRRVLRVRIARAVAKVCRDNDDDNFNNIRCRQLALAGAKPQIAHAMARSTQFAQATPAPASATTASGS